MPEARVVYADNDPLVLRFAEPLVRSNPQGRTAYVETDITDPRSLLDAVQMTEVLCFCRPMALSVNAVL